MWTSRYQSLHGGSVRQVFIESHGDTLHYSDVVEAWQKDGSFREYFISLLVDSPFTAYYWEMPPVTTATLEKPFEFVLVDSPELARATASPHAFREYFQVDSDQDVVTFPNLGNEALLVAPCPRASLSVYPHLAAFVRGAPMEQQHALWQQVGQAINARLSESPLWVSTAGLGVYWLHVRMDSQPKYYSFQPYKDTV